MSQENVAAQEHLGELINTGKLDRLGEVFATDVVDHDPAPDQAPGVEGIIAFFKTLAAAFPDAQLTPDALVDDEDHVCLAYRVTGTHEGDSLVIPPTGRKIEARGLQIGRFEDGKIVERWGSSDELGILKALGADVAPVER